MVQGVIAVLVLFLFAWSLGRISGRAGFGSAARWLPLGVLVGILAVFVMRVVLGYPGSAAVNMLIVMTGMGIWWGQTVFLATRKWPALVAVADRETQ